MLYCVKAKQHCSEDEVDYSLCDHLGYYFSGKDMEDIHGYCFDPSRLPQCKLDQHEESKP